MLKHNIFKNFYLESTKHGIWKEYLFFEPEILYKSMY